MVGEMTHTVMGWRALRGLTAAAALAALAACGGDRAATVPEPYRQAVTALEGFIQREMQAKGIPALSVALVEDQNIVWARGFGEARPEDGMAATEETVYRVGSVSKLFTDIAIMQLVETGVVELDAPVRNYLPEFSPRNPFGVPVTLRHLMSHRAGLVREPPVGNYFEDTEPTLAATVASLNGTELVHRPGERSKYSNAGIGVVGYVLERLLGQPFVQALEEAVLQPAGMSRSAFHPREDLLPHLAEAYMWTYDGRGFQAPTFQLGMSPAGSLYSTVTDLGRFLSILFAGGSPLLSNEALEHMWTPQFAEADGPGGFGLGFMVSELDGTRMVGHGGAIYGFATELAALPEERLGVVVALTLDGANVVAERVAHHALRLMRAARDASPLPLPFETSALSEGLSQELQGRYEGEGGGGLELVGRNGRLLMTPTEGGFRSELRARGDTLLTDDRLSFGTRLVPLEDGSLLLGGDTLRRVPERRPDSPRRAWLGLLGEYGWDHNTLYILERNGLLHALVEWFFLYPLEEVSPDVFRFPAWGLYSSETLAFTRDSSGGVAQVVMAGIPFRRREVGTEAGVTFRIEPVRPVEELLAEALAAAPPVEEGNFLESDLVDLASLDPTLRFDIRYAGTNNFMGAVFYPEPKAFLQRPAAEAVVRAHRTLETQGFGLLIYDAYRPWYVTKMFWEATPESMKHFVADPAGGSRHNRGAAVDLTLFERATGRVVETVGGYDEFSDRSYPEYPGGTSLQRWHRETLRRAMEAEGFAVYEWEWWHFDHEDWRSYPIGNVTFDRIGEGR
jgi:CubicO group peptidase (beta-lactamase class C family)/D-alanyl-D-alanine dipeptidase